jgi:AcrR family transcriptional regulator
MYAYVYMSARDDVLAAGYAVLREVGAPGLSLCAVAKAAGVTPMALYRHFENRDDLAAALRRRARIHKHGCAALARARRRR